MEEIKVKSMNLRNN